jgi:hypothetical protein
MLRKRPLKGHLNNDPPLSEESDCPPRSGHQVLGRLVSGLKLLLAWQVVFWVLSTITIFYAFGNILTLWQIVFWVLSTRTTFRVSGNIQNLWLRPSAWRHDLVLDDKVTSFVTAKSIVLSVAVAVQATVLIFELGRSNPRGQAPFLVPTLGNTSPKILNYHSVVNAILVLFLTATTIASSFCTPLLLSDLGPSPRPRRGDSKRIPGCLASSTPDRLRWSEPDFSTLPPTILPTFAQYTDLSTRDTQHGVDDT